MKLPLVVQKSLGCSWLEDSGFNHVADYLTDENAKTIAHRVNVHDELVAALEGAHKALEDLTTDEFSNGGDRPIRLAIAAALAKVKP